MSTAQSTFNHLITIACTVLFAVRHGCPRLNEDDQLHFQTLSPKAIIGQILLKSAMAFQSGQMPLLPCTCLQPFMHRRFCLKLFQIASFQPIDNKRHHAPIMHIKRKLNAANTRRNQDTGFRTRFISQMTETCHILQLFVHHQSIS